MGKYDVTVTITGYEQDRFITWEVSGEGFPSIGHYYGYRLEPVDGGTLVTSIYDWSSVDEKWKRRRRWPIIPESALKATLGILERTVRRPHRPNRRPGRLLKRDGLSGRYRYSTEMRLPAGSDSAGIREWLTSTAGTSNGSRSRARCACW